MARGIRGARVHPGRALHAVRGHRVQERGLAGGEERHLVPAGEAVVLAPLAAGKFEPDVVLIYGNPAQMMLLMNGLQFKDYERFNFFFIGEGDCADGLAQCYTTGKPALAIPCFGERRFGGVTDDEMVIALSPEMIEKAVAGLQALWERGLRYPIMYFGPECDPSSALARAYPGKAPAQKRKTPRRKK